METKTYDELYEQMQAQIVSSTDKVSDFTQGSIMRSFLESVARIASRIYTDTKIGYDNNLKAIPYAIFNFSKKNGTKASGEVVFSSSVTLEDVTIIPIGTEVTSGTYTYKTTTIGRIEAGELSSNTVSIIAEDVGVKYNAVPGSITTIKTVLPNNVVSVTNEAKIEGGTDEETDSELISRFRTYINGLQGANSYGVKSAVLSLDGVRSCSIEEHTPPKEDIYNFTVWIDDGTGGMSDDLKESVEDVINGDGTEANPGKRPAGTSFDVLPAESVNIILKITGTVSHVEVGIAKSAISTTLEKYINSLTIGQSVLVANLVVALKRLSYIKSLTIETQANDGKGGDYDLSVQQIARFSSAEIDITSI